jgi:hypothetical protein
MNGHTSLPNDFARAHRVHLNVLSNSAIACFRACPRQFKYRYLMLRRPLRNSEALRFGSFFHVGLNAWWVCNASPEEKFAAAIEAMRARAESRPEDADPFDLVKAEELMLGYTARWGEEGYETIAVEQQFDVPLVNPETGRASKTYRVQGSIDVVVRRGDKLYQFEHKTTSSDITPGADYWRKVSALDSQVSTYLSAARAAGFELDSCVYDVVRKVALIPKKATPEESRRYTKKGLLDARQRETDETPEEFRLRVREHIAENPERYYARGPIVRLENDEREHAGDVWQTAAMIRMSENSGHFPRNPGACERFHRLCDYFDVCSGMASIDDDTRFRTAEHAHEELVKEV